MLLLRIMLTALVVLIGITALESVQQLVSVNLTIWTLHSRTITLIALISTLLAYFTLRQYRHVVEELSKWQIQTQEKNVRLSEANAALETAITERQRVEAALRESEERYALAARGTNDGLWDWNLTSNEIYLSPRCKEILGYAENELGDRPAHWFARIDGDDVKRVRSEFDNYRLSDIENFESEFRMRCADGTRVWILCRGLAVRDENGRALRMAGSLSDITERKAAEQRLRQNALYDALTGLPNRALFTSRLKQAVARGKRQPQSEFAVLFLDLDGFKVTNDSLGHLIGDFLLTAVAQRLQECVRATDTLARLGGDEFTILIEDIHNASDATRVAERIQSTLAEPFQLDGHQVFCSASIGIALSRTGYEDGQDMMRDADIAMYRAKAGGRGLHQIFDPNMHERAMARLTLEYELRQALQRNEFILHYQPIVHIASERILGFEVLTRWQSPRRGLVSPMEFIPVAEEIGLIGAMDRSTLRAACAQMRAWQEEFPREEPLLICVNLSAQHFIQLDLVDYVEETLRETGLDACSLKLEITETALLNKEEMVMTTLERLRALGVHLSMDDFGTGYSSLSYLHRFPLNTLKVDRSFISRIGSSEENIEIVQTIIDLAHHLKMDVVAEGVETQEQANRLLEMGCEYAQGFLFAKPLAREDATQLLKKTC